MTETSLPGLLYRKNLHFRVFKYLTYDFFSASRLLVGHEPHLWRTTNKPFALCFLNYLAVIHSDSVAQHLRRVLLFIAHAVSGFRRMNFLFVSGLPEDSLSDKFFKLNQGLLHSLGHGYTLRWLGGYLTNMPLLIVEYWRRPQQIIKRLQSSKKRKLFLENRLGIKVLNRFPDVVCFFSVSGIYEIGFREAIKLRIPTLAFVDTNVEVTPTLVCVPSNDDSVVGLSCKVRLLKEVLVRSLKRGLYGELRYFDIQNTNITNRLTFEYLKSFVDQVSVDFVDTVGLREKKQRSFFLQKKVYWLQLHARLLFITINPFFLLWSNYNSILDWFNSTRLGIRLTVWSSKIYRKRNDLFRDYLILKKIFSNTCVKLKTYKKIFNRGGTQQSRLKLKRAYYAYRKVKNFKRCWVLRQSKLTRQYLSKFLKILIKKSYFKKYSFLSLKSKCSLFFKRYPSRFRRLLSIKHKPYFLKIFKFYNLGFKLKKYSTLCRFIKKLQCYRTFFGQYRQWFVAACTLRLVCQENSIIFSDLRLFVLMRLISKKSRHWSYWISFGIIQKQWRNSYTFLFFLGRSINYDCLLNFGVDVSVDFLFHKIARFIKLCSAGDFIFKGTDFHYLIAKIVRFFEIGSNLSQWYFAKRFLIRQSYLQGNLALTLKINQFVSNFIENVVSLDEQKGSLLPKLVSFDNEKSFNFAHPINFLSNKNGVIRDFILWKIFKSVRRLKLNVNRKWWGWELRQAKAINTIFRIEPEKLKVPSLPTSREVRKKIAFYFQSGGVSEKIPKVFYPPLWNTALMLREGWAYFRYRRYRIGCFMQNTLYLRARCFRSKELLKTLSEKKHRIRRYKVINNRVSMPYSTNNIYFKKYKHFLSTSSFFNIKTPRKLFFRNVNRLLKSLDNRYKIARFRWQKRWESFLYTKEPKPEQRFSVILLWNRAQSVKLTALRVDHYQLPANSNKKTTKLYIFRPWIDKLDYSETFTWQQTVSSLVVLFRNFRVFNRLRYLFKSVFIKRRLVALLNLYKINIKNFYTTTVYCQSLLNFNRIGLQTISKNSEFSLDLVGVGNLRKIL